MAVLLFAGVSHLSKGQAGMPCGLSPAAMRERHNNFVYLSAENHNFLFFPSSNLMRYGGRQAPALREFIAVISYFINNKKEPQP
jgi:hypothetical protein